MLFNSIAFLWFFLPISIIVYYIVPNKIKNTILVTLSFIFYIWGGNNLQFVWILLIIIIANYFGGILLNSQKSEFLRKITLILCILFDLSFLIIFKYMDFIILHLNTILNLNYSTLKLILPLGISFFTFQTITYIVDVYKKIVAPQYNLIDLSLYITFFPKLVMGPIVKYRDMEKQLHSRKFNLNQFAYGIKRFIYGLSKKIIIADVLALGVDRIFLYDVGILSTPTIILGVIMYSLQLYYDFSGYSDMAIGISKMFGFDFKENFNYPYIANSIKDFWRRWHISLSSWFRDYIYIPLGGNQYGKISTYLNLLIVFILTGIWHGAAFNFWLWGIFHGFFIIVERIFLGKWLDKNPYKIINIIYSIFIVFVGWAIFRCSSLSEALYLLKNMFIMHPDAMLGIAFFMNNKLWITIILAILFSGMIQQRFTKLKNMVCSEEIYPQELIIQFLLLAYCILNAVVGTYGSFIYFKF